MNTVKVRNIEIGAGIPKICVPIVGVTREEILAAARISSQQRLMLLSGVLTGMKISLILQRQRRQCRHFVR